MTDEAEAPTTVALPAAQVDAEPQSASTYPDLLYQGLEGLKMTQAIEPAKPVTVHPLVGQTVLYVLPDIPDIDPRSVGQVRPAIVIRVWSDTCVQLHVLLDSINDLAREISDERYAAGHLSRLAWRTSVNLDQNGYFGTWRPRA